MNTVYEMMAEKAVADAKSNRGCYYPIGLDADQVVCNGRNDYHEWSFTVAENGDSQEFIGEEQAVAALVWCWMRHDEQVEDQNEYPNS